MGYREDILSTSGLVGYWRFGESNTNAGVVAETGVTGVFPSTRPDLNSAGALVGDTNTCYRWASSNSDYIYWPGNNYTFANRAAFSLEIWYQPTTLAPTSGYMNLISKDRYDASASGYGLYLSNVNKRLYFTRVGYYDGVFNTTGPIVSTGTWYHIVCTYDGTTQRIYSNGSLVASSTATGNMSVDTNTALYLGRSAQSAAEYLSAWMDEFAIYNRALSATEVSNHYESGTKPIVPEYGGANIATNFLVSVDPSRNRQSRATMATSQTFSASGSRSIEGGQSFSANLSMTVDGNVFAFPTHSMPTTSSLTVSPVRQRPTSSAFSTTSDVTVRMPMKFLETHTLPSTWSITPKSAVKYESNKPRFPTSFSVAFSGMTRVELDELFRITADRRSGTIHYASSRLTREHVTIQHPHTDTLDPQTLTPFVALNDAGIPRVAGTATVDWYISRVVVDATNRVYDRPDVLSYFGISDEVVG